MILVKMSVFFSFNLHTEESEHQNVKSKVVRKEIVSTNLSSFATVRYLGGKYPRGCISGVDFCYVDMQ